MPFSIAGRLATCWTDSRSLDGMTSPTYCSANTLSSLATPIYILRLYRHHLQRHFLTYATPFWRDGFRVLSTTARIVLPPYRSWHFTAHGSASSTFPDATLPRLRNNTAQATQTPRRGRMPARYAYYARQRKYHYHYPTPAYLPTLHLRRALCGVPLLQRLAASPSGRSNMSHTYATATPPPCR